MINFKEELEKYHERVNKNDVIQQDKVSYKELEDNIKRINKELTYIILNSNKTESNTKEKFEEIEDNFERVEENFQDIEDRFDKLDTSSKDILNFLQEKWWGTVEKQNNEILFLKREIKTLKDRESKFQKALIKILDSIEWINKYIKVFTNNSVENTVNTSMKVINKELSGIQINIIGKVGELFDESIHNCIDVVKDETKVEYEIIEVIKKGYMFKGQVLRPAQVIVVSNEEE